MQMCAPWEKAFKKVYTPFEHFIHSQTTTGLVLMIMTLFALIIANSPFHDAYEHLIHTKLSITIGSLGIAHSLHHWINDGLMAVFFFLIGLEIKREILKGELSNIKVAILPILSAIGGMLIPALIYIAINHNQAGANGWGIPMATDIAFAISALVLLGRRVSPALVTFLVALAIVDDLGAVIVIALFYTAEINLEFLGLAGAIFLFMLALNRLGVRAMLPYFLLGIVMWFFMLESGVHATIAGVIAALTIPSTPKIPPVDFTTETKKMLDLYENYPVATDHTMHEKQKAILQNIKERIAAVISPADQLEQSLHLPVSLIIIPLFAFANAGIAIDFTSIDNIIFEPVSLGIIFGLVGGKIIGIAGTAFIAIKSGIAKLPQNSSMSQLFGVAALGGIGFTMSIFVADLAFIDNPELIFQAKIGILTASLCAGALGFIWLRFIAKPADHEA